ncbi:MAG: chemotaxis protein CheD [Candidatus Cloacimonetes bacterium]|nr:chemotaxis protein CheD [Candidatus Cloacimonadota bacterium]
MKNSLIVNIADMKVSANKEDIIVTYSLGSCVAIVLYEPVKKLGGMIHIMLPDSTIERDSKINPYKYVDTGVPVLFKTLLQMGATRSNIITKVIGGSSVMDKHKFFNIGERNYVAVRKILWRNNILIKGEDVGGSKSRTVRLEMATGKVTVSNANQEYEV